MAEELHCFANAIAGWVNEIVKQEYYLGPEFRTKAQPVKAIRKAIGLYNRRRPHAALNYQTPERVHRTAA